MHIYQVVPSFLSGDAVGNYVDFLNTVLGSLGHTTKIFTFDSTKPNNSNVCHILSEKWWKDESAIVIYHFAVQSKAANYFIKSKGKKILIYHNTTPSHFFSDHDAHFVNLIKNSEKQLRKLSRKVDLALGVSNFNKEGLTKWGFKNTQILPIFIDFEKFENTLPDEKILNKYADQKKNILFVSRVLPHKKYEDILKTFYFYQQINPESRLIFVGPISESRNYYFFLQSLIKKLNLDNVIFTEKIPFSQLLSFYKLADIYISMSEHEGFGVPLLEAFYFKVPVIAYNSSAVPETLGYGGILFNHKKHELIAELIDYVICNDEFKNQIIKNQNKRFLDFSKDRFIDILKTHLNKIVNNC